MRSSGPIHNISASTGGELMALVCPCGSGLQLSDCCGRLHAGASAASAEALMRSRYSAYALGQIDYLISSTLPAQQASLDRPGIEQWSRQSKWLGLTVHSHEPATDAFGHTKVSFSARWEDDQGSHEQRENSVFVQRAGNWYFLHPGVALQAGRNDPCPCTSGGKFKKCCASYL